MSKPGRGLAGNSTSSASVGTVTTLQKYVDHHRRAAFRANSHIWGIQSRAQSVTQVLHRNAENPGIFDFVAIHGSHDLKRLRKDASWKDLPGQVDLISWALEKLGWQKSTFQIFRFRMEYPVIPSSVIMEFELPQQSGSE